MAVPSGVPERSLELAKEAYGQKDPELSRIAHDKPPCEKHNTQQGKYVKSIVFGALDGIITTFAIVAGIAGADLSSGIVLILGLANLVADGVSMGFGDYLSTQAEVEFTRAERQREMWECENYLEGEKREMVELYEARGLSREDAEVVVNIMSKKKEFFVDIMMVEELGLMPVDESESPAKSGFVTFVSFLIFGAIPLLAYQAATKASRTIQFIVACLCTAATLFTMGALKSRLTNVKWWKSGLTILLNGGIAAGSAYLIGLSLSHAIQVDEGCD